MHTLAFLAESIVSRRLRNLKLSRATREFGVQCTSGLVLRVKSHSTVALNLAYA